MDVKCVIGPVAKISWNIEIWMNVMCAMGPCRVIYLGTLRCGWMW